MYNKNDKRRTDAQRETHLSSYSYYMIQTKLKINGKQSCLAVLLTTSVTIKSLWSLNDHYVITLYYMPQLCCRFHSQFVQSIGNNEAGNCNVLFIPVSHTLILISNVTRATLGLFLSHLMSADFPAAVGQSHFESLDADSCGLERQVFPLKCAESECAF